ncbi:MAG: nuclear transport factor 2 family protein [Alphaproteobacteria bacterium]|nr:nuclear transport factor 2 family protein [Alphaproteobacteria bacterium]MCY4495685.1 nuclear transport factor 2 family protein [Rhodospirillaceae bacterium]
MSGDGKVTIELIEEINAAFDSRDPDRIASYFAEDGIFATARGPDPWGYRIQGRDNIREFLAKRFEVVPDMKWEHDYKYVTENRAVAVWTVTGQSANGEVFNYRGCDLYDFKGGKISHKDTFWKIVDSNDLGGLPASA